MVVAFFKYCNSLGVMVKGVCAMAMLGVRGWPQTLLRNQANLVAKFFLKGKLESLDPRFMDSIWFIDLSQRVQIYL